MKLTSPPKTPRRPRPAVCVAEDESTDQILARLLNKKLSAHESQTTLPAVTQVALGPVSTAFATRPSSHAPQGNDSTATVTTSAWQTAQTAQSNSAPVLPGLPLPSVQPAPGNLAMAPSFPAPEAPAVSFEPARGPGFQPKLAPDSHRLWWSKWEQDGVVAPMPPERKTRHLQEQVADARVTPAQRLPVDGPQIHSDSKNSLPLTCGAPKAPTSAPADSASVVSSSPKDAGLADELLAGSSDSTDLPQVGDVASTLRDMFPDLAALVPDVLAACDTPGKAFDKLQQMQEEEDDNAFNWDQPAQQDASGSPSHQADLDLCLDLLEQQWEMPRPVLEEVFRQNGYSLEATGKQLMAQQEYERHQQVLEDHALAQQVSRGQGSPAASPLGAVAQGNHGDVDAARRHQLELLAAGFPLTPHAVLLFSLEATMFDVDAARLILKEGGHEEIPAQAGQLPAVGAVPLPFSSPPPQPPPPQLARSSPPSLRSSPLRKSRVTCKPYIGSPFPSDNQVYLEERQKTNEINRQIFTLTQEYEDLTVKGRHMDASLVEAQIRTLQKRKNALDKAAKRKIFESMNKDNCVMRILDLHGLHVMEAIETMDKLINLCLKDPFQDTFLEVVTGKGNNSLGGVSKLRQAVHNYLRQRGMVHTQKPDNAGVICLRIPRGANFKPFNKSKLLW